MSHEEADRKRQQQEREDRQEERQHPNETARVASSMESSRNDPTPAGAQQQKKEPVSTGNKMERLRAALKSILGPRKPPTTSSS